MKKLTFNTKYFVIAALLGLMSGPVTADVPNTFTAGDTIRASEMNANFSALDTRITANEALEARINALETHAASTANPHSVDKAQVGLGNVEDIRVNTTATTAPSISNDSDSGYPVGSVWINTTNLQSYVLVDATPANAVWKEIERTYNIGDTGPAGGIVFYVYGGGKHGLEAAPGDQSVGARWCSTSDDITGATGLAVGDGQANTAAILAGCTGGTTGIAAQLASEYSVNDYTDWFLPSKDELALMYTELHLNGVGGFASLYYWSSSQGNSYFAWNQDFFNGFQGNGNKIVTLRVRAVRAF